MSYITVLNEGRRKARKPHQCFDCYRTIPVGEVHAFQTCKYDHVYTIRQHTDCFEASEHYRTTAGISPWDYDEGIPPLKDIIIDGGEFELDMARLRGRFPHVVCRLEISEQLAQVQQADRLLADGHQIHPDDFPPIYG